MRPLARFSVFHFSQFCIIHFCLYMYVYAGLRAHASWNHHLPCAIFFGYDLYVLRSLDYPWDAGYTRLGVWVHSFLLLAKSFYIQLKIPSRRWLLVGKCTRYSRESAHVFAYIGMKSHGVSGLVLGLRLTVDGRSSARVLSTQTHTCLCGMVWIKRPGIGEETKGYHIMLNIKTHFMSFKLLASAISSDCSRFLI